MQLRRHFHSAVSGLSMLASFILVACGSTEAPAPVVDSQPFSEPANDPPPAAATPAWLKPSFQQPVLVTSSLPTGTRNDLTDPAADAICAVRFTGSRTGFSESDYRFDIWDHADVAATLLGGAQLDLNFGWAGVAAEHDNQEPYLEETRYTISFVPDVRSDFMTGEIVGTVFKSSATRTCDKTGGANEPVPEPLLLGAGTLQIQKRTASSIDGVITLADFAEDGGKLTFSAPIAPLVQHDDTVCCLKNRYQQATPSEPPMNAQQIAAACKARDAAPPVGSFEADPELGLGGFVDVTVDESLHDSIGVSGNHVYASRFALTFHSAFTKGTNPVMESQSWEGWTLAQESSALIVQPFGVGRHDGLSFGGYTAGSTCGDGFGFGGSGTFSSDLKASLVITTHTDELVEGTIELPGEHGTISKVRFKSQLHPPSKPSVCCLGQ